MYISFKRGGFWYINEKYEFYLNKLSLIDDEIGTIEIDHLIHRSLAYEHSSTHVICANLIFEYQKHNMPVIPNIALFYKDVIQTEFNGKLNISFLENGRELIDKFYPQLQYGSEYYYLVFQQLKLFFIFQ